MSAVWLIGQPVAHSLSPAMQNAAFAALGLPHRYEAREVAEAALPDTLERMRREDVLGANVTIPHKEATLKRMDEVGDEAKRIGSVNTILRRGSRLVGENTDGYGFRRALETADARVQRALILGAGGAARACVVELLRDRVDVRVANRTKDRADRLARSIEVDRRRARSVVWPTKDDLDAVDAVINATPLGLHNEDPLRGRKLPRIVVDLVPMADETPLVRRARAIPECTVVDGLTMLLFQGARSFNLWTGLEPPLEAMRAALPRPA